MGSSTFPSLGVGVGLRPPYYQTILENPPEVSWFEAISENYLGIRSGSGGRPIHILRKIADRYPIVLHGISLSMGSTDPLDFEYLRRLKKLTEEIRPPLVSDHLCWTGVLGQNLHDLLPLPFTEETLNHVTTRVVTVQEYLERQILLENVSSYLTYDHSEMTEWEFLSEISKRTDCGILLDINNIYVSSVNHQFDALSYLEGIPIERVGQFHLAGYSQGDQCLIDTHDHPVSGPVWELYRRAVKRFGDVSTLIEWDDRLPKFAELLGEAKKAEEIRKDILAKTHRHSPFAPPVTTVDAMDHHRA